MEQVKKVSKKENGLLRDKRGISPVIATVILVAVTIVVAVAVAYWMGGIASLYTRYEKIQISSAYAVASTTINSSLSGWVVTVNVQNTGTADATITNLLINGKPWNDPSYSSGTPPNSEYVCNISPSSITSTGLSLLSGKSATVTLDIVKGLGFTSGVSVEIKIHSASGQDYPTTITLS
jgi:flagellin-like protein